MASPTHNTNAVSADTLITIKVSVNDSLKKLKLPLRDLGANVLPDKLRQLLSIKPEQSVTFERFSDSAGTYIALDPSNPQVFKTLIRAAKAKLKLRLKATVSPLPEQLPTEPFEMPEEKAMTNTVEPVIVRSPVYSQATPRESAAIDGRSIGSGIFQFRESRASRASQASQQTLVDTSEAPVPRPFTTDRKDFFEGLAEQGTKRDLAFRNREVAPFVASALTPINHPWSVYCNECDVAMADAHFHCNICDGGDYDLCENCVAGGKLCPGEDHWLIKRFIKDGKVISSTTERISPRQAKSAPAEPEVEKEVPGAFTDETKTLAEPQVPTRTCNSCVVVLPEREFVTCTTCADFDLCIKCHVAEKHGHHPAHAFKPATDDTVLPLTAEMLLAAGRNVRHSAICDGCDKKILGVRYKCLNCPDWDYCSECHENAQHIHPRHRFAPLYEPIPEPRGVTVRHHGIYCDGPLCSNNDANQTYIQGVRYKCAVCHDTDFCAACEALPGNQHNRTHPLIKFKTPVRNVSITTENEDLHGQMRTMGDRRPAPAQAETKTASTETTPVAQANAATQVQTLAEIKPTEQKSTQPIPIVRPEEPKAATPVKTEEAVPATLLNAHFVQDTVSDGTVLQPGARFTQLWTLRNPGPYAWPSGCSVRFVGGDNMLNVDNARPAAVSDIANASESNVVGRDVQVGEEVAFKVTLKAPTREGKHISYWRMKSADGTPFGHRLWCDIEVKVPAPVKAEPKGFTQPQPAASYPPTPMYPVGAMPHAQGMWPAGTRIQLPQQPPQIPHYTPQQIAQQDAQMKQMLMQQQQRKQMLQQQQMINQRQMAAAAQAANAAPETTGPPPAYNEAQTNMANLSSRIAAMREQQAKRREHMMQQFHAQLDQRATRAPSMPATQAAVPTNPTTATIGQDDEKARKEAARQRVEHIKAKILRAREEQAKAMKEATITNAPKVVAKDQAVPEKKSTEGSEDLNRRVEYIKKRVNELTKPEAQKEAAVEDSQMVFPKLEKESPASSTYESAPSTKGKAAYVENEQGEVERSASPSVASPAPVPAVLSPASEDDFELDDDIEVLSANGEDSEDDGFLTDEEYDILDASDNETVASK